MNSCAAARPLPD